LTLALGIGANTAIFSTVNAVVLRPLPVQAPDELVSFRNAASTGMFNLFSYPNYRDLREQNEVFADLMAYRFAPVGMSHDGVNERVWCYMVSGNYFPGLGLRPHLGRLITSEDDQSPGAHPVAVLGYESWQKRFGGRADIIGKEIIVNGRSYTIIGVAPKGFSGTEVIAAPELWFPAAMQADLDSGLNLLESRDVSMFFLLGRVKPQVSAAQVQANLDSLSQSLAQEFPEENKGMRFTLLKPGLLRMGPFRNATVGFAALLLAVSGLVLLLACANLSNMLLARATERREETAIRLAMGASRSRLVRQLLTESTLLAFGGGLLGMLPALWPLRFNLQMRPPADFPIALDVHWDYRVLAFGFFITLVTGILFGLLPALQATKADVAPALKSGQLPGRRRGWVWGSLIAVQVALSLVLLTGAGLMVRALRQAGTLELGFDPHGAIELGFDLRMQGYDPAGGREIQKQVLERVRAVPGVRAAGITDLVPVDLHFSNAQIFVEGAPEERTANTPRALNGRITPGYFAAMGTRLLAGRDFTDDDGLTAEPVAIVNQAFARRFWPGEDALGKRFSISDPRAPKLKIVGIVQDGKYNSLASEPRPFAFRSLWQYYAGSTGLVVRSSIDPQSLI
ncbi:MAG: ABC transporter permease, partial [Candidatus Acidiferrales bacterium]